jgi:hypothetical protein
MGTKETVQQNKCAFVINIQKVHYVRYTIISMEGCPHNTDPQERITNLQRKI